MSQHEQTAPLRSTLAGEVATTAATHYREVTPELVRQVTEQVYWLFLRDLRLEWEWMAPLGRTSLAYRR